MKKLLLIALVAAGCNILSERKYTVIEVSEHYGRCKYSLYATNGFTDLHQTIIDRCGLFNVGDTVCIKMTPTH